ncbi:MAG: YihY/virulence factor BrkB family protein, partial [bacterium]
MVLIAMSLASKLLGRDEGLYERLIDLVSEVLPASVMPVFSATLSAFLRQGFGAGVLGVVVLVLTASNAY